MSVPVVESAHARRRGLFTALGIVAVLLWGSTVAFARSIFEQVDTLAAAALMNGVAGSLACLPMLWRSEARRQMRELPVTSWLILGGCFCAYMVCLYLAIGLSADRQQALGVGVINYLWPSLTLVLAVPIFGHRWRGWLIPGVAMAAAGVVLANSGTSSFSVAAFLEQWQTRPVPYLLALAGAVLWALYSNLTRRLAGGSRANPVPVLLLASAVLLAALRIVLLRVDAYTPMWQWSARAVAELAYLAVFPTWLAYQFWDQAMRRGSAVLVTSFSYLTPLLSVLVYVLYLRVPAGAGLWVGCGLVMLGAVVCRYSVSESGTQ